MFSPSGAVFACTSTDEGESWSPATVIEELVNTDSKIHVIKLRDGRLVLAYNDHPRPFAHDTSKNELVATRERTRLVISISNDEGNSWERIARIDRPSKARSSSPNLVSTIFGGNEHEKLVDFRNEGVENPFQLRQLNETSEHSVQYHYPYLLEMDEGASTGDCKVVVGYTKSKLNIVTQKTTGHEIWLSCVPRI